MLQHGLKYCPCCRRELSLEMFGSDISRPDGLACWCKDCVGSNGRKWYKEKKAIGGEWLEERRRKDREIQSKRYQPHPLPELTEEERQARMRCAYIRRREWAKKHPERVKQYLKKYRAKPETKEKNRQRARERYQNDGKYRQRKRLASMQRTARKNNAVCTLTRKDLANFSNGRCLFCGTSEDLCAAHDIPVVKQGSTSVGNLFVLCRGCNSMMGTRELSEMFSQLEL